MKKLKYTYHNQSMKAINPQVSWGLALHDLRISEGQQSTG